MLNIVTAPESWLFTSALCLMLMIGIVEALGLGGIGSDGGSLDSDNPLFAWIGIGQLPLSVALIVFLGIFGLGGLILQEIVSASTGARLPWLPASVAAAAVAVPATGLLARVVARILPADETTAVSLDSLVGRRGHIVLGIASLHLPARAKVRDAFGHSHYVLVEPHLAGEVLREGEEILLVAREAGSFLGITVAPHITFAEGEKA
jgi:hypothetical protein